MHFYADVHNMDRYSIKALILILFGLFINQMILDIASNCHDIVNSILGNDINDTNAIKHHTKIQVFCTLIQLSHSHPVIDEIRFTAYPLN